jgi:hypothetical protein
MQTDQNEMLMHDTARRSTLLIKLKRSSVRGSGVRCLKWTLV